VSGGTARSRQLGTDLAGLDLVPTCSRCQELSTPGDKWCTSCGCWLLLTGPTSAQLTARRNQLLLAGLSWPEDMPPRIGEDDSP